MIVTTGRSSAGFIYTAKVVLHRKPGRCFIFAHVCPTKKNITNVRVFYNRTIKLGVPSDGFQVVLSPPPPHTHQIEPFCTHP